MSIIQYFATEIDHRDVLRFVESFDLPVYPAELRSGRNVGELDRYPNAVWYIANVPLNEIVEHPATPGFPRACNPFIRWDTAVRRDRTLVAGSFSWTNFSENICRQSGANHLKVVEIGIYFRKIRNWIRKNWANLDNDNFWFGPDAMRLREDEGYIASSSFNEDTVFEQIVLDDDGNEVGHRFLRDISEFEDR